MCNLQSIISGNYFALFVEVLSSFILSCHIVILLIWLKVLFKCSLQLRKNVKKSALNPLNQSLFLQALNTKVEYHKSLFLLTIVICELISALLTLFASTQLLIFIFTHFDDFQQINNSNEHQVNSSNFPSDNVSALNNTSCNLTSTIHAISNLSTFIHGCFGISLILAFTPVYTLMSYYAMVVRNSLNYTSSIKSVNLSREQKLLILNSFLLCLFLFFLLIRVEVLILFELFQICAAIIQLTLTFYYSKKVIIVFKYKILDTYIAFGTGSYQFKLYKKILKKFQIYIFIYRILVTSFCTFLISYSIRYIVILLYPEVLHSIYAINLDFQSEIYVKILDTFNVVLIMLQRIPYLSYITILFMMNLSTIPFLLSK